jgi:hypothetical protein
LSRSDFANGKSLENLDKKIMLYAFEYSNLTLLSSMLFIVIIAKPHLARYLPVLTLAAPLALEY